MRCCRCGQVMTLERIDSPKQSNTFWNCSNCGKQQLWPAESESRTGGPRIYDLTLFFKARNPDKDDLQMVSNWLKTVT